jgi:putative transposase
MARKLRFEFPGALYHIINRGNYRRWIFDGAATRTAFEACLFEACERSGWLLHAFVIMGNHYHLAVETPEGNLVAGMQWLQATFANRFNRLRRENGHLFQGRYKSLVLEDGPVLGAVCDYIHLNPVRAGLVTVKQLSTYRHGSYWYLLRTAQRRSWMRFDAPLQAAGEVNDSADGRRSYQSYLEWQAAEGPAGKTRAYVNLSRGWALGSREFKAALVQDQKAEALARAWEETGAREIREIKWAYLLGSALRVLRRKPEDLIATRKSASWKLTIACWLKVRSQAGNGWLARHLHLGISTGASRNISRHRSKLRMSDPDWKRLNAISST